MTAPREYVQRGRAKRDETVAAAPQNQRGRAKRDEAIAAAARPPGRPQNMEGPAGGHPMPDGTYEKGQKEATVCGMVTHFEVGRLGWWRKGSGCNMMIQ